MINEALSLLSGQTCQMCTRWIQCEPEHDWYAVGCKAYDNPFDMNYDNPFDDDNPLDQLEEGEEDDTIR